MGKESTGRKRNKPDINVTVYFNCKALFQSPFLFIQLTRKARDKWKSLMKHCQKLVCAFQVSSDQILYRRAVIMNFKS